MARICPARLAPSLPLAFALLLALGATATLAQDPCVVQDNGTGTVDLPPAGCDYLTPAQVHQIIDGLPPGTTINLHPIHAHFFCPPPCGVPGGGLGGNVEDFQSVLLLQLRGTGDLQGFRRNLVVPAEVQTHTGPRTPGDPVQTFPTDMFFIQGAVSGDSDFAQIQVIGGTGFGLPSPGQTTLTQLPDGGFQVDSFFDVSYQITFVGAPGSVLDGLSGTTQGTVRMEAEAGSYIFTDGFESGDTSRWTLDVGGGGTGSAVQKAPPAAPPVKERATQASKPAGDAAP